MQIRRKIGQVYAVDVDKEGLGWGKCLKVRAEVELTKPLLQGTKISIGEHKVWLDFKYERLQNFYFRCGVLKHKGRDVLNFPKLDQEEVENSQ